MGLFRRKRDEGFIDVGDDLVAVSPERIDEFVDVAMERVMALYETPVSAEVNEAIGLAIQQRHEGPSLSSTLGSFLASIAQMGYCARQNEESFESFRSAVPMLADEVQKRLDAGVSVAEAYAAVALDLCDYSRDDPASPRSLDAIDGLIPVRDKLCHKTVVASVKMAQNMEIEDEFPPSTDFAELVAHWRIGFLIRGCETSRPNTGEGITAARLAELEREYGTPNE